MRSLQKEPQQVPPCRGVVTTINTVEAAGIEPASRDVSTRTSTRVVDSLRFNSLEPLSTTVSPERFRSKV